MVQPELVTATTQQLPWYAWALIGFGSAVGLIFLIILFANLAIMNYKMNRSGTKKENKQEEENND